MKLNRITFFIFAINSAIDTGKYQDITMDEVSNHLETGDIVDWLSKRMGDDLMEFRPEDMPVCAGLNDIAMAYSGHQARKKFGVERSGLCYLIALATELIQRQPIQEN